MIRLLAAAAAAVLLVSPALAQTAAAPPPAAAYDAEGWISDLQVVRQAMATRYANLQWAAEEREIDLAAAFDSAERQLRGFEHDSQARALFDRFEQRLGDGHVEFRWPEPAAAAAVEPQSPPDPCASIGVQTYTDGRAIGPRLSGYRPLGPVDAPFPTGLISVEGRTVGVLRVPVFMATTRPELCAQALAALSRPAGAAWDDAATRQLYSSLNGLYSAAFIAALKRLKDAGAEVLLLDLAGNPGGSEWAEAAARMLTPVRLESARLAVVRHPHWLEQIRMRMTDLDAAIAASQGAHRQRLQSLRAELLAMRAEVERPCDASALLQRRPAPCAITVAGPMRATGLLASGDPALREHPTWTSLFDPYRLDWREGVWRGPLLVLVDEGSASAAEEVAATLQDNRAALIIGAPTMGAGCGFVNGGIPTPLPHSGGTLMLPDCVRLRADGSNEVMGVQPDLLIGIRRFDGLRRRALRVDAALPEAVRRAAASTARPPAPSAAAAPSAPSTSRSAG